MAANLILAGVQLVLANIRAGDGAKLSQLQQQSAVLKAENLRLTGQILSASSLAAIEQRSQQLQLIPRAASTLTPVRVADSSLKP